MNDEAIKKITEKWAEPRGIPFKGQLISKDGCMCAQGQVLHYLDGVSECGLRELEQTDADDHVAKLLGISVTHSVLLRAVNDSVPGAPSSVLTDPEVHLGPNWRAVLGFWYHAEQMTEKQEEDYWDALSGVYNDIEGYPEIPEGYKAVKDSTSISSSRMFYGNSVEKRLGFWGATIEIIGAAIECDEGESRNFFYLPMFGFDSVEEIPTDTI